MTEFPTETTAWYPIEVEESGVHGRGIFARTRIPAGSPVLTCGGKLVGPEAVQDPTIRALQVGPDLFLMEDSDDPRLDDFVNHSCEPNLGFAKGDLVLWSLREIHVGEELLIHYSTTMNERGWEIPCDCGTATCKGEVRSYCDLDEPTKAVLRPITLEYLRQI